MSLAVRLLVPVTLVGTAALIVVALSFDAFTLHVQGLVGAALGDARESTFSILSLALFIPSVSQLASPFVLRCIQALFVFTTLVAPLAWPIVLLYLWLTPLRPRALRWAVAVAETLYAWAMLDCLVVILAASLLELDQVAKFTLGDECVSLNSALRAYHSLGDLLPGEASCFGVVPTLNYGYWVLAGCAALQTLAGFVATFAAHAALADHAARAAPRRQATLTRG